MKKKNSKPKTSHSDEENVPSWIDHANDRITPYTDEELDLFIEGFKKGMSDTPQGLAATLSDTEILKVLHRIYYRFDLINFNCEMDRPGSGGAFAKTHLPEVEKNFAKLKELAGVSEKR